MNVAPWCYEWTDGIGGVRYRTHYGANNDNDEGDDDYDDGGDSGEGDDDDDDEGQLPYSGLGPGGEINGSANPHYFK